MSDYGNQMAKLHTAWKECKALSDDDLRALEKWLTEVGDYMRGMGQGWLPGHITAEAESLRSALQAREASYRAKLNDPKRCPYCAGIGVQSDDAYSSSMCPWCEGTGKVQK